MKSWAVVLQSGATIKVVGVPEVNTGCLVFRGDKPHWWSRRPVIRAYAQVSWLSVKEVDVVDEPVKIERFK